MVVIWTAKDFAQGKIDGHFNKHKLEWENITKEEYLKRSKELLNSKVGGNIDGFVSKDGTVFRYNAATNEFATAKADGTIETLFRPKNGIEYWKDQKIKYGGI